jgi:catechol 2,3-dioxygenase-like lactoylglutathione lyase family enzyme
MRFGHLEILVRDLTLARAFWEDGAGGVLTSLQGPADAPRFAWIDLGGGTVLLRADHPERSSAACVGGPGDAAYGDRGPALVLYAPDVRAAVARFAAKGFPVCGDDGGCPVLRCPDGTWVQIVDPGTHGA